MDFRRLKHIIMTVDFKNIEVEVNFEGERGKADVSKDLANYCKCRTTDIGFEDFCREIYHKGTVDVPEEYKEAIIEIIRTKECPFYACIKRGIIEALNKTE